MTPVHDKDGNELWVTEGKVHACLEDSPCDPELSRRLTVEEIEELLEGKV